MVRYWVAVMAMRGLPWLPEAEALRRRRLVPRVPSPAHTTAGRPPPASRWRFSF